MEEAARMQPPFFIANLFNCKKMKTLFDTQLLESLNAKGRINFTDTDSATMYDEFVRSVIALCTSTNESYPAYFTLHYTRLELESYQSRLCPEGAEKKYTDYRLHPPLP